jgi:hypothetical protein
VADGLQKLASIALSSPGVAVRWHPNDVGCMMVAEQLGYIRLLDCSPGHNNDNQDTMNMHCRLTLIAPRNTGPLTGADWKPQDRTT